MTVRSSFGLSRVSSGEQDFVIGGDATWTKSVKLPPMIYCHAASGTTEGVLALPSHQQLFWKLAQYFTILATDLGGPYEWGNATTIARLGTCVSYMSSQFGLSTPVQILTMSMGTLAGINYARSNPSNVSRISSFLPCVDLDDMYVNNRAGVASTVATAYGGSWDLTDNIVYNPMYDPASLPNSVDLKLMHSTPDNTCPPSIHVTPFAASRPATKVESVTTQDHTEASCVDAIPYVVKHAVYGL